MAPKRTSSHYDGEETPSKKNRYDISPVTVTPDHSSPKENALHSIRSPINAAGKSAECGVIRKIMVENFMCHRKLKIDLCSNVNFIYGQNGSGKSAILAALQICLGVGANRTHRARNLKDLVRKEGGATFARVRVTLLNKGPDAFQQDLYGDSIHIERNIYLRGSGIAYKLYAHDGKKVISQKKKDLQLLLDQMNIQVENPVAVLDQEEAKKFLTGRAEDKYNFFLKATDLERMDRKYKTTFEHIVELESKRSTMSNALDPLRENLAKLQNEWKDFEMLEPLEIQLAGLRVKHAWSIYNEDRQEFDEASKSLEDQKQLVANCQQKLDKEMSKTFDIDQEEVLNKQLQELTAEATEACRNKAELVQELKDAIFPRKRHEHAIKNIEKQANITKRKVRNAEQALKEKRDEIMKIQGSAGEDEARRVARMAASEKKITEAKLKLEVSRKGVQEYLHKHEGGKRRLKSVEDQVREVSNQCHGIQNQIRELQSQGDNSLRMFGPKCEAVLQRVTQAQRRGQFRGKVIGPIGKYLKISPGKDRYAAVAEKALQIGLDRFIVTNKQDRSLYLKIRQDAGCSFRDCGVFQMSEGPRYAVRGPPDNVETLATIFTATDDLVYNCLVDNGNIDQKAVCNSYDESGKALEIQEANNKSSIRGGNIKTVYCLPNGDYWQIFQGNKSITSSDGRFRKKIGCDTTEAIKQAQDELEGTKKERDEKARRLKVLKDESHEVKVKWNAFVKAERAASNIINVEKDNIERIREEADAADNVVVDTSEYEDDVSKAKEEFEQITASSDQMRKDIDSMLPGIQAIEAQVEEVNARNKRIAEEISRADNQLQEYLQSKAGRDRNIEKRTKRLEQEEAKIKDRTNTKRQKKQKADETLRKSKILRIQADRAAEEISKRRRSRNADGDDDGDEDEDDHEPELQDISAYSVEQINAVEIEVVQEKKEYFQQRMDLIDQQIETARERLRLTESDPEVALKKFQAAKHAMDTKTYQIDKVDKNKASLIRDLKAREKLWIAIRGHIVKMSNATFDEVLNRKGSSGQIKFDHVKKTLNLVVQKDNADENSQTNDVKSLSGGERSYTTLALLLALGESLETPFRVMDEFDVFLDPIARKIALQTMIKVAKSFEHRQFIFITPQDVSNITTDSKLKIFQMKPPKRNQLVGGIVQQTL